MLPISLSRQLFSTVASSARASQSSASLSGPASRAWVCRSASPFRSQDRSNRLIYPKNIPQPSRRCFSTTSVGLSSPPSSPFRLTSRSSSPDHKKDTQAPFEEESPFDHEAGPDEYYCHWKPKRQWPPDMSKLSPKHQFRLERKYRRRAALKYARPKWVKMTKLVQWGIIGFILIYAVLFMDWETQDHPFEEFRKEFFATINSIFSPAPPPGRRTTPTHDQAGKQQS